MDNDRERPAQIQHMNTQTNFESQKFHVRDTTNFSQDDFKTRKCLSGPPTRRPRGLQSPKKYPGRACGAPRCTVRAALRHPGTPRGAAQARYCKPLQREHDFHRPRGSTWHSWSNPAPPRSKTSLKPYYPKLFSPRTRSTKPPPPPGPEGRRTYWAAPTAADPEKRSAADDDREKPAQIQHINTQTNFES